MKKRYITALIIAALLTLSGCTLAGAAESEGASAQLSKTEASGADSNTDENKSQVSDSNTNVSISDMFTDNDMEIGYDEETSAKITLSGDSASCDSNAVQISDSTVTITDEGTYILSGTLNNGMIKVNADDKDKVRLVLDGAQITNSTSAAIYILEADKVFITTASGSENTLSNGGEYIAVDDNNIDAVIYSKSDLTLNGSGTLTVNAAAGHGIVSKDDLVLTSGAYTITAASRGLSGKDSVRIANGIYTITSGKDGIRAENTDNADLGFLYIADGSFEITADGDGISADAYLQIDDGDFTVNTGEGSASVTMPTETMGFGPGGGFRNEAAAADDSSVSQKGIKSDGTLTIAGGSFVMDTTDDSFHASGDILVKGGVYELRSGDDTMHSDAAVTIEDGNFNIEYCYEGIEGLTITVNNGTFDIAANDDGLNAAGGADSSGFGGGRPGWDQFSASSDSSITINGGTFVIVSDGDCIDSNGALTINGGSMNLTCNGNGNTALDCDGTYANNGGDITTNDGSENNPGQMGGGMGGPNGIGGGMGGSNGMERPGRTSA